MRKSGKIASGITLGEIVTKFIIKNEIDLERYLSHIVKEAAADAVAASGRDERSRQRRMDDLTSEFEKKNSKDEVEEAEGSEEEAPKEKEVPSADIKKPSEQKVADAGLRDIIKTLNVMRSGRSTKDPEVKKALKSYVDGLTSGEQQSLYAFLSGLSEMMVGGETGKEATDPNAVGLKTKPIGPDSGDAGREEVKVKVKKAEKKGTSDAPIIVGEHADKSRELQRLHELRRG